MKNNHKLALISIARAFVDNTKRAGLYKITDKKYNRYIENTNYEYHVYNRDTLTVAKELLGKEQGLIEEISENSELRHSLYIKGIETARKRDWKNIEKRVKEVYIGGRV